MMRKLLEFYVIISAPLALIVVLNKYQFLENWLLVSALLFYAIVYRTCTDGKKLANKSVISRKNIWKMIIPGMRVKYFKELYLS